MAKLFAVVVYNWEPLLSNYHLEASTPLPTQHMLLYKIESFKNIPPCYLAIFELRRTRQQLRIHKELSSGPRLRFVLCGLAAQLLDQLLLALPSASCYLPEQLAV